MRQLFLLGMAAITAVTCVNAAQAADMPTKAPPPAAAPEWSWTGFYVGGHLGAGWARKEFADPSDDFSFGSHNAIGVLGGFQAGYNWQVGRVVLGIEGQFSFADLKGDHQDSFSSSFAETFFVHGFPIAAVFAHNDFHDRFSTNVRDIATIAARLGLVSGPGDRTLWYVKGGAAWARDNFALSSTASNVECVHIIFAHACEADNFVGSMSTRQSRWGWMVGTGIEFGLFDNWSAKVEYNYLDLGDKTVHLTGTGCTSYECFDISRDVKVDQTMHIIKFGLNYRFWAPAPVTARY